MMALIKIACAQNGGSLWCLQALTVIGPDVIKHDSCLTHMSMKCVLVKDFEMPLIILSTLLSKTFASIVGILVFIKRFLPLRLFQP